jgi:hypothetical protein
MAARFFSALGFFFVLISSLLFFLCVLFLCFFVAQFPERPGDEVAQSCVLHVLPELFPVTYALVLLPPLVLAVGVPLRFCLAVILGLTGALLVFLPLLLLGWSCLPVCVEGLVFLVLVGVILLVAEVAVLGDEAAVLQLLPQRILDVFLLEEEFIVLGDEAAVVQQLPLLLCRDVILVDGVAVQLADLLQSLDEPLRDHSGDLAPVHEFLFLL